ncbi:MAG: hypothetical protein IKT40_07390 [Bacilli bacterium]|nr:hypothetical protein [Bacilli bacterium]
MQKLGYIVSKTNIKESVGFVEVVNSYEDIKDFTKPILIVGLNEAKKFKDGFSILNKRIDKNIFWTFTKMERRIDYEKDIIDFYNHVLTVNINNLAYKYINLLNLSKNKCKNMLKLLNNSEHKYIYISNDMIYCYYNNNVFGFSLSIAEYCGIKKNKILRKLKSNNHITISYNDYFIDNNIKKLLNNKRYAIAYFMKIYDLRND